MSTLFVTLILLSVFFSQIKCHKEWTGPNCLLPLNAKCILKCKNSAHRSERRKKGKNRRSKKHRRGKNRSKYGREHVHKVRSEIHGWVHRKSNLLGIWRNISRSKEQTIGVSEKVEELTIFERKLEVKFEKGLFPFFHVLVWLLDSANNLISTEMSISGLQWCKGAKASTTFDPSTKQVEPGSGFSAKVQTPSNNLQCALTFSEVPEDARLSRKVTLGETIAEESELVDRMIFSSTKDRPNPFEITGLQIVTNAQMVSKSFDASKDISDKFMPANSAAGDLEPPVKLFNTIDKSQASFAITAPQREGRSIWETSMLCINSDGITQSAKNGFIVFRPVAVRLQAPKSMFLGEVASLPLEIQSFTKQCTQVDIDVYPDGGKFSECVCNFEKINIFPKMEASDENGVSVFLVVKLRAANAACKSPTNKTTEFTLEKDIAVETAGVSHFFSKAAYLCPTYNNSRFFVELETNGTAALTQVRASLTWSGNHLLSLNIFPESKLRSFHTGETNLIRLTKNVAILEYFNKEDIDKETENEESRKIIKLTLQHQLNYRHDDGSFSRLGKKDSFGNLRLTSQLLQTFVACRQFVALDDALIDSALQFLIYKIKSDGCFEEEGNFLGTEGPKKDRVTLTAFVLCKLSQTKLYDTPWRRKIEKLEVKALRCLLSSSYGEKNLRDLSTFAVALRAHALSLWNPATNITHAYLEELDQRKTVDGESVFWKGVEPGFSAINVETTSYAVMSILRGQADVRTKLLKVMASVRWLTERMNRRGEWYAAFDSIAAQQALSEVAALTEKQERTQMDFVLKQRSKEAKTYSISQEGRIHSSTTGLSTPNTIEVSATGSGCAFFHSHMAWSVASGSYPLSVFSITSKVTYPVKCYTAVLKVCVGYKSEKSHSTVAILRVKMATGWKAKAERSLKRSTSGNTPARVDVEENNSWIFYHNHMSNNTCISAELERTMKVTNLKPIQLLVFDYYRPERKQVAFQTLCE